MDNNTAERDIQETASQEAAIRAVPTPGHSTQVEVQEVASVRDCIYWTKRAVEIEKLLRSLKDNKILLDQAKGEITSRKKMDAVKLNLGKDKPLGQKLKAPQQHDVDGLKEEEGTS